jgi:hypothetical protein
MPTKLRWSIGPHRWSIVAADGSVTDGAYWEAIGGFCVVAALSGRADTVLELAVVVGWVVVTA